MLNRIFIILVIFCFCLSLILVGLSFYFSTDNLIGFIPPETQFYLHLNLNPWHPQGQTASQYLRQNWHQQNLKDFLEHSQWSFLREAMTPETFDQIDEAAIFIWQQNPALLIKYKSAFSNICFVENKKIFRYFLQQNIVLISPNKTLEAIKTTKNDWKRKFQNISWKSFGRGFLQNWRINFYLTNRRLYFIGENVKEGYSGQNITIENRLEQFIAWASLSSQKSQEKYLYRLKNYPNFTNEELSIILQKKLAILFPEKKKLILPDKTNVNEIVANPNIFLFKRINLDHQTFFALNRQQEKWPQLYFFVNLEKIILSNDEGLLSQYLNNNESTLNLNNQKGHDVIEESFYWTNPSLIISGSTIKKSSSKNNLKIQGFIDWQ